MANRNISFLGAIWGILGAALLFLIFIPIFRFMDTILDAIIPSENEFLRMIAERSFFAMVIGIVIGIPLLIVKYLERRKRAKESSWPALAASRHLTFVPGKFFGYTPCMTVTYRHHHLKLEAFTKIQGKQNATYTRLSVSIDHLTHDSPQNESHLPGEQVSHKDAISLLTPTSPHYILKGAKLKGYTTDQIVAQTVYVCYEQEGIENDSEYLGTLFDLLSDLAEAYSAVAALGGEAVPFLKKMLTLHHHELITAELLGVIARNTTARVGDRAPQFLCPSCLTRYKAHKVLLTSSEDITYYGCRTCSQSREFLEGRVVAVLDSRMGTERIQQEGTWRVNWLIRRDLFDFDEVEIVQATDEDVERFAVQVGNDTDEFRRSRYKEMSCNITLDCRLSENTLRILKSNFE